MNKRLLDYIRSLSEQDTKTLSQKALKTTEEVGELAKKILPYEGAFATNHRVVGREGILEEVADVMLCALSIAYNLGATDEELEATLTEKSTVWSNLQARENGGKFPLPFEIHVTVNLAKSGVGGASVRSFQRACESMKIKPIILDLQSKEGASVMNDVMTSSKHFGSNTSALAEANLIKMGLEDRGFNVVRVKLETVPWHPAAPQKADDPMPKDCYFESHIPVTLDPANVEWLAGFNKDTLCSKVHMSRNVFKTLEDGRCVVMLTYRDYKGYASEFVETVNWIVEMLKQKPMFEIGKVHTEFAVYDTKVSHDASWLK